MNTTIRLLILGVALLSVTCGATEYFVSSQGSDAAAGTRQAPFATIQKAASIMQPGDTCYITAGTYSETVIPARSGTADLPIVYIAEHESVVLTGTTPLPTDRWKQAGQNLFKCKIVLPLEDGNQLFLNGKPLVEARCRFIHPERKWRRNIPG